MNLDAVSIELLLKGKRMHDQVNESPLVFANLKDDELELVKLITSFDPLNNCIHNLKYSLGVDLTGRLVYDLTGVDINLNNDLNIRYSYLELEQYRNC